MPDIEINSSQILAELNKINNGVKVVESNIASSNNANKSSYDMLKNSVNGETSAIVANTNATSSNAATLIQAQANLTSYNSQVIGATTNLGLHKAAWDAVTASIQMNSTALTLNTATLLQNMTTLTQHTMASLQAQITKTLQNSAIAENTAQLLTNTLELNLNSAAIVVNTAIRGLDCVSLLEHIALLGADSVALLGNTVFTLLSAVANGINGLSLYFVNKQLKSQIENLEKATKALKENSKATLINILANIGNFIATLLLNKQGKKNVEITRQQTLQQFAYNGALAAAAILKNPLIGAATVAGAALAQGLMSAQKPPAIECEGTSKDVPLLEMESSSGGLLTSDSGGMLMIGTETESSASASIGSLPLLDAPKMATGGVVTKPTFALIGEGKYNEAVLPLGNSPQMRNLKNDIANAVVQALLALNNGGGSNRGKGNSEVVLNVDGQKLARILLPKLYNEQKKHSNIKVVGTNG